MEKNIGEYTKKLKKFKPLEGCLIKWKGNSNFARNGIIVETRSGIITNYLPKDDKFVILWDNDEEKGYEKGKKTKKVFNEFSPVWVESSEDILNDELFEFIGE